jgi:hypothetical protein
MHMKYSDKKKYQNIYCSNMLLIKYLIEVKGKLIYKNQLLIKKIFIDLYIDFLIQFAI